MCFGKDQSFHKDAIDMVARLNLGGVSIYTFCLVHPRSRCTSYEETTNHQLYLRGGGACVHCCQNRIKSSLGQFLFHAVPPVHFILDWFYQNLSVNSWEYGAIQRASKCENANVQANAKMLVWKQMQDAVYKQIK